MQKELENLVENEKKLEKNHKISNFEFTCVFVFVDFMVCFDFEMLQGGILQKNLPILPNPDGRKNKN